MTRAMFSNPSKAARSDTPDYSTPRQLVEHMVTELANSQRWSWVTFETDVAKHFVEVAREGDDELIINMAYDFAEDYKTLFARHGITIPDGWRLSKFKPKGWFATGTMLLTTGIGDIDRIAQFVDRLFLLLYGEPQDYHLSGVFQA